MKTATRYMQRMARRGRFGRDVRATPVADDAQQTRELTTMPIDAPDGHEGMVAYVIDANAVAEAILIRLIAGRTFGPEPREASRP
jgi:hypothetical protein